MKANQKGFSVVEILIVIVVVGLLGAVGWMVYDRQNSKTKNKETVTTQSNQKSKNDTDTKKIDTPIHEVDIKMQTAADIDKLPEYTPASFKAYMLDILQKNRYYHDNVDDVDTISQYQITKISQVNIVGGHVPVDKNGEGHAGGAPAIWVLTPTGAWDKESLNGPVCTSKNGGKIYEEFVKECYTDYNGTQESWEKNPNGSIKSSAQ